MSEPLLDRAEALADQAMALLAQAVEASEADQRDALLRAARLLTATARACIDTHQRREWRKCIALQWGIGLFNASTLAWSLANGIYWLAAVAGVCVVRVATWKIPPGP